MDSWANREAVYSDGKLPGLFLQNGEAKDTWLPSLLPHTEVTRPKGKRVAKGFKRKRGCGLYSWPSISPDSTSTDLTNSGLKILEKKLYL